MACLQWRPCCHPQLFCWPRGSSALENMLPGHVGFHARIKWALIKRSFYKDAAAVVCVISGMPRKVFSSCGAAEGRWLKGLIIPMSGNYCWQVQSCLVACRTGERASNQLERWHRSDVPSPHLDGRHPSCPAAGRASAQWSEQRSLCQQLPNVNSACAATA